MPFDTFFGGGILATVMENSRLDEAAAAAAGADRRIAVLRTELGLHVSEMSMLDRPLAARA